MIFSLFKQRASKDPAAATYQAIVKQARNPGFYRILAVPDTPDGRFDLILLHMFLVIERLNRASEPPKDLKQALFDIMFHDMDENLREMGIGDVGVAIRIKKMVESFYGRMTVYREALTNAEDTDLGLALRRNVYRKFDPDQTSVNGLCRYIRTQEADLMTQPDEAALSGSMTFLAAISDSGE